VKLAGRKGIKPLEGKHTQIAAMGKFCMFPKAARLFEK